MDSVRVETALATVRRLVAPDDRVACFDVEATLRGDGVVLSGAVQSDRMRQRTIEAVAAETSREVEANDVTVLDADAESLTTDRSVSTTPVRSDPAADAERVTSLVHGMAITGFDRVGDWRRVRTPDGYLGWVRTAHLQRAADFDTDAVLTADVATDTEPGRLYAGTPCAVARRDDDELTVQFRTGAEAIVAADAVAKPLERAVDPARVVAHAERYLGTEYVWGGMTTAGIDCSGLAWMAYWQEGVRLPRDADQQREVGTEIPRSDAEPGDLLFFPGHVAISLGGDEYVHASGSEGGVTTNSFDPKADGYAPEHDEDFEQARRIL